MTVISESTREKKRRAGQAGGLKTFFRACGPGHDIEKGRAEMVRRGRRGGRPRLLTLAELERQSSSLKRNSLNTERGKGQFITGQEISFSQTNRELEILDKCRQGGITPPCDVFNEGQKER